MSCTRASVSQFLPRNSATLSGLDEYMLMDAYLKKEQIGTLFCQVGALEAGFGGWVVPQGCQFLQVNVPSKNKSKMTVSNHPL